MRYGRHVAKLKNRGRKITYVILSIYLFSICFLPSNILNRSEERFSSRKLLGHYPGFFQNIVYSLKRQNVGEQQQQQQQQQQQPPTLQNSRTSVTTTTSASTSYGPTSPTIRTATIITITTITTTNSAFPTSSKSLDIPTTIATTNTSNKPKIKESCEPPSLSEFPRDLFTQQQRTHGAFVVHLIVALYMFVALAIICDYYFIPSLEVICAKLELQSDVAGASLMAIGSSAPELFASMIGAFVTEGDIGIGTILGSAIFNVLFVMGICGMVSSSDLYLAWWPIMRDGLCYAFSLIILTIVIFDGQVRWKEATFMVTTYFIYLILMYKNRKLEKWFYLYVGDRQSYEERFETIESAFPNIEDNAEAKEVIEDKHFHSPSEIRKDQCQEDYTEVKQTDDSESSTEDSDVDIYPKDPPRRLFELPSSIVEINSYILTFPIHAIFYFTIPDIRRKHLRHLVGLTFLMSIFWIGVTTYILVWMVAVIGFTVKIPDAVMGLTFIAFGSSVPDALASILVAKQGKGDMAVAQALGSNVFDVLLGLGLPWLIKIIFDSDSMVKVQSVGMIMSCFFIFLAVIGLLCVLYYYKFTLSKKLGGILIVSYVIFLFFSVTMEIFVWSRYHLPTCKTL